MLSAGFPGGGARRFTQAHHIVWWERGGRTDLDNLVLMCSFHHRLVHEYGWRIKRDHDATVGWFHPDGRRYRAGPAPPPKSLTNNLLWQSSSERQHKVSSSSGYRL